MPTNVRGRVWVYSPKVHDLVLKALKPEIRELLPSVLGVIVGEVSVVDCRPKGGFAYVLREPVAYDRPRAFRTGRPAPLWWRPTGLYVPKRSP